MYACTRPSKTSTNILKIDNDQHDEAYYSQIDRQLGLSTRLDYTRVMALRAPGRRAMQAPFRDPPRTAAEGTTSGGGAKRSRFDPRQKLYFSGQSSKRVERE